MLPKFPARFVVAFSAAVITVISLPTLHAQTRQPSHFPVASSASNLEDQFMLANKSSLNPQPENPPTSLDPTISVAALSVNPAARREMERSQKSFNSGDLDASISHLKKAVHIDPNCAEAHSLLGFRYFAKLDYPDALLEFRTVSSILPSALEPLHNQSLVLFSMDRYPEAESAARHLLDIDPAHQPTRYLLGRILVYEDQFTPETIQLLRDTQKQFPAARLALADLYLRHNKPNESVAQLKAYLADPNAPDKPRIESLLAHWSQITNGPAVPLSATIP
jgi:tetratricopeptide (TPR) repeat protein